MIDTTKDYVISGPYQRTPQDTLKALRNDNFKTSLVKFLCEIWQNDFHAHILRSKTLYVNCEDASFYVVEGRIYRVVEENLFCTVSQCTELSDEDDIYLSSSD